mgnify:CR=1 FL=1
MHCLDGDFISKLEFGEQVQHSQEMTYIVSDNTSSHRSLFANGVELLIIDGAFFK